jgi:chromosome segregation ATPase
MRLLLLLASSKCKEERPKPKTTNDSSPRINEEVAEADLFFTDIGLNKVKADDEKESAIERLEKENVNLESSLKEAHFELSRRGDKLQNREDLIRKLQDALAGANQRLQSATTKNIELENARITTSAKHEEIFDQSATKVAALQARLAELEEARLTATNERDEYVAKHESVKAQLNEAKRGLNDIQLQTTESQATNEQLLAEIKSLREENESLQRELQLSSTQARNLEVELTTLSVNHGDVLEQHAAYMKTLQARLAELEGAHIAVTKARDLSVSKHDGARNMLRFAQRELNDVRLKANVMKAAHEQTKKELETEIDSLKNNLQAQANQARADILEAQSKAGELETVLENIILEHEEQNSKLVGYQRKLESTNKEKNKLLTELTNLKKRFEQTYAKLSIATSKASDLETKYTTTMRQRDEHQSCLHDAKQEILQFQIQDKEMRDNAETLKSQLEKLQIELRQTQTERDEALKVSQDVANQLADSSNNIHLLDALTTKLQEQRDQAMTNSSNLTKQVKDLQHALAESKLNHAKSSANLSNVQHDLEMVQANKAELEARHKQLTAESQNQQQELQAKLEVAQAEAARAAAEASDLKQRVEDLNRALTESRTCHAETAVNHQAAEAKLFNAQLDLKRVHVIKTELEARHEQLTAESQSVQQELTSKLEAAKAQLAIAADETVDLKTQMEDLQRALTEAKMSHAESAANHQETAAKLFSVQRELETAHGTKSQLLSRYKQNQTMQQKLCKMLAETQAEVARVTCESNDARKQVETLQAALAELKMNHDESTANHQSAEARLLTAHRDLEAVNEAKRELEACHERVKLESHKAKQELHAKLVATEAEATQFVRELSDLKSQVEDLQHALEEANKGYTESVTSHQGAETKLFNLQRELEAVNATNASWQVRHEQLAAENQSLRGELEAAQANGARVTGETVDLEVLVDNLQDALEKTEKLRAESAANHKDAEAKLFSIQRDMELAHATNQKWEARHKQFTAESQSLQQDLDAKLATTQAEIARLTAESTNLKMQVEVLQQALVESKMSHADSAADVQAAQIKLFNLQRDFEAMHSEKTEWETCYEKLTTESHFHNRKLNAKLEATSAELATFIAERAVWKLQVPDTGHVPTKAKTSQAVSAVDHEEVESKLFSAEGNSEAVHSVKSELEACYVPPMTENQTVQQELNANLEAFERNFTMVTEESTDLKPQVEELQHALVEANMTRNESQANQQEVEAKFVVAQSDNESLHASEKDLEAHHEQITAESQTPKQQVNVKLEAAQTELVRSKGEASDLMAEVQVLAEAKKSHVESGTNHQDAEGQLFDFEIGITNTSELEPYHQRLTVDALQQDPAQVEVKRATSGSFGLVTNLVDFKLSPDEIKNRKAKSLVHHQEFVQQDSETVHASALHVTKVELAISQSLSDDLDRCEGTGETAHAIAALELRKVYTELEQTVAEVGSNVESPRQQQVSRQKSKAQRRITDRKKDPEARHEELPYGQMMQSEQRDQPFQGKASLLHEKKTSEERHEAVYSMFTPQHHDQADVAAIWSTENERQAGPEMYFVTMEKAIGLPHKALGQQAEDDSDEFEEELGIETVLSSLQRGESTKMAENNTLTE